MKSVVSIVRNTFKNDSRVLKEALSLSNNNYRVSIAALAGEELPLREEISERCDVYRIGSKRDMHIKGSYLSFFKEVVHTFKHYDIIHCNDIGTLPIGFWIKTFKNRKAKIVYDAHEYETEMKDLSKTRKIIIKLIEKSLIKTADAVLTVSESIANEYARLYKIPKPALILNTPTLNDVQPNNYFRIKFDIPENKLIFLYQGGLGIGRGVEKLIEVFSHTSNDKVLIFMGYGPLEGKIKQASENSDNIFFHEAVPPSEIMAHTSSADVGISYIENICLSYYYCLPNKLFEYVMAGIPVLVSSMYEQSRFVESNNIGYVMKSGNSNEIAQQINSITRKDLKDKSKAIPQVREIYNWGNQEKKLLDVYEKLFI